MNKLLIIEDNCELRKQLKWGVGKEYDVMFAGNCKEAIALFYRYRPKVVTLGIGLSPDENGIVEGFRCLEQILSHSPTTRVIVITEHERRDIGLKAVQTGAYDFYRKPIQMSELRVIINRAFNLLDMEEKNARQPSALEQKGCGFGGIIGQSPQMLQVFSMIRKVSSSDVAVFITGESGTGKELVAKALHNMSLRKNGPFVPINCGAIPENLLESELFGTERGAFTGAHARILGKAEYAHKGTMFLDEIGELPGNLQVKLLRFLQEKVLQRVGGREDIAVDARIISATNMDIARAIGEGLFREDLYYRIAVITINLPPLRERGDDIMLLANLFLKRATEEFCKKTRGFSTSSLKILKNYTWPGNVRELENRVQRAVIMSDSPLIEPADLGLTENSMPLMMPPMGCVTLKDARDRLEREMIISALGRQEGNIAKTAEVLGVSRPTLYDLMKKYSLSRLSPTPERQGTNDGIQYGQQ
ncbi:PEP-CTERM-box response regulator transcription factor [Geotalea toluenoxydans]|uniref:PEP-CTERM-box response regulator transcription factor n=1 Tax=Geotalea toluenoxydans TaxID=421624 RepID=UPI0006D0C7B1|nr:PEP-CTERM-box response regulator transcription factor [Geotalea toluenoxydans]